MIQILAVLAPPLRLLHALAGVLLVAGLLGRYVALMQAERAAQADDLRAVRALLGASRIFEQMVIQSSIAVLLLGFMTAWSQGYQLVGFLQGGRYNWLLVSVVVFVSTLPLVPLVFLSRGRRFGAALDESVSSRCVTPGLIVAFADPVTRAAHIYAFGAVVVVLVLMIAKPF